MGTYGELQAALEQQLDRLANLPELQGPKLQQLAEKLRQNRFNLVVLGAFKRGKSSLINALLGEALLPTAIVPLTEVKVKFADLYRQWEIAPHTVRFPNGETLDELRARSMAAVTEVVRRHPDQVVLLAAHRAVNKVLIAAFIGLDNSHFWRLGQDTTAVNRFKRVGDTWHILPVNDVCHLRGLERGPYMDF